MRSRTDSVEFRVTEGWKVTCDHENRHGSGRGRPKGFDSMPRLRISLTLLAIAASALIAPLQAWGGAAGSSRIVCPEGNLARRTAESGMLVSGLLAPDATLQVSALASENEEQRGESALDESRVLFLMPWWSFRKALDRPLASSPAALSNFHLRC
jgi:hypothetical protein